MKLSNFDYNLPPELIAQKPLKNRHLSKLLVLDKNNNFIHDNFINITKYLNKNDILVLNNSKVFNARIFAKKQKTGGIFEFLLLNPKNAQKTLWTALVNPGRRAKIGDEFIIAENILECEILERYDEGIRLIKILYEGDLTVLLDKYGKPPVPPYIKEELEAPDMYQTVYAEKYGSIAAPTAGFHFTSEVFNKLKDKNIKCFFITLHVGLGTFRPVKAENITEHIMLPEYYEISGEILTRLNKEKERGANIVAVGTTATRALESSAEKEGKLAKQYGWADLFIYPGYKFKFVDSLITNFHLPKSTLLMLISGLKGTDVIKKAYKEAVNKKYRFYSFGDVMFIK